jgi:hypothetical protein
MVGLSKTTQGDLIQRRQEKLQVSDWNNKHLNVTEVNRDQETLHRLEDQSLPHPCPKEGKWDSVRHMMTAHQEEKLTALYLWSGMLVSSLLAHDVIVRALLNLYLHFSSMLRIGNIPF